MADDYCMMNRKGYGTKKSWPDLTEHTEGKKTFRIVGEPAEIRFENLLNTSRNATVRVNLFGTVHIILSWVNKFGTIWVNFTGTVHVTLFWVNMFATVWVSLFWVNLFVTVWVSLFVISWVHLFGIRNLLEGCNLLYRDKCSGQP
jgi:hypothetical protein